MKHFIQRLLNLIFPPKCVLCRKLLEREETDLCHSCRCDTFQYSDENVKLPYLAQWTALWYYEGNVRRSIHGYKFFRRRSYAKTYARLLGLKLQTQDIRYDILSWVPISTRRRWQRGYDQSALLAKELGKVLGGKPRATLKKIRHNQPQATLRDASQRRANALGAYRCTNPELVRGKRVLLLDDVITTGATAGECARVLLTAGASAVLCATVAAASHQHKNSR